MNKAVIDEHKHNSRANTNKLTETMATIVKGRGGRDYQFVEEPPRGLRCVICQDIARQPQQHGECGKLFCMSCLNQHTQSSAKCPNCSLQLVTFYDGRSTLTLAS